MQSTSISLSPNGDTIKLVLATTFLASKPEAIDEYHISAATCLFLGSLLADDLKRIIKSLLSAYAELGYPDLGSEIHLPSAPDRSSDVVIANGNTCPLTLTRTYTYPDNEIPNAYLYYPQSHFAAILHHLLSFFLGFKR